MEYLNCTAHVGLRIPISLNSIKTIDGEQYVRLKDLVGSPEIVSKFITEPKEQKRKDTKAAKQKQGPIAGAVESVEYAD